MRRVAEQVKGGGVTSCRLLRITLRVPRPTYRQSSFATAKLCSVHLHGSCPANIQDSEFAAFAEIFGPQFRGGREHQRRAWSGTAAPTMARSVSV